ncbi:MAG TPA: GAP family protein [Streptosporangiaceae bacterium]
MFEQAAGLAVVAAFYPPAMLIAALYLASNKPGRLTAVYVIGGTVIVSIIGIAALLAMRDLGLSLPHHQHTRYGLRLGLGVLALIAAVVLYRRKPKQRDPSKPKKPGLIDRLSAEPRPKTAFLAGILMFGPSLTFLAAVQVVATAKASVAATVGAMIMIIVLTLAFAWVPLVAYLVAPDLTARRLGSFDEWLKRHGKAVLVAAVALIGVLLIAQGIAGLA